MWKKPNYFTVKISPQAEIQELSQAKGRLSLDGALNPPLQYCNTIKEIKKLTRVKSMDTSAENMPSGVKQAHVTKSMDTYAENMPRGV